MLSQKSLVTPLIRENPVTFHVLGICAALAITNSLTSSLIMSVAMTTVLVISNAAISLIRKHLPGSVRIIVQITIIASAVTVIDQVLTAFMPATCRLRCTPGRSLPLSCKSLTYRNRAYQVQYTGIPVQPSRATAVAS